MTVAAVKARHRDIPARLRDAAAQRVIYLVKSGEVDFGIGSRTGRDPELPIPHRMDDPPGVALPHRLSLERRKWVRLEDLRANR